MSTPDDRALPSETGGPLAADRPSERAAAPSLENGGSGLEHVGNEVAAVLQSAHAAADEMRAAAQRDSERIRAEAEAAAERAIADARREAQAMRRELRELRDDADKYAKAARDEAEAYAVETRRTAEADARRKEREANEMVRAARAEAKGIVQDATSEGERRRTALEAETSRFEERLANILTIFQGVAVQIEDVLTATRHRPEDGAGETRDDESLGEALRPAAAGERSKSSGKRSSESSTR